MVRYKGNVTEASKAEVLSVLSGCYQKGFNKKTLLVVVSVELGVRTSQ